MPFKYPKLEENSPLDTIAGSRSSVASVSSECGILEAFPLPDSMSKPPQGMYVDRADTLSKSTLDALPKSRSLQRDTKNVGPLHCLQQKNDLPQDTTEPPVHANTFVNRSGDAGIPGLGEVPNTAPSSRAQWWRMRYGHTNGSPFQSPGHSRNNSDLVRPPVPRTHVSSRSWDAGAYFQPSPLINVFPLSSAEEHLEAGCNALVEQNYENAGQHWFMASSPPWNNDLAKLLIQLGLSENWFADNLNSALQLPNISVINSQMIRAVGSSAIGILAEALSNYAAKLKASQYDAEALHCYELAGQLGSRDATVTAAHMYFKGGRNVKKDVAKARRLFKIVNEI